MQALSITVGKRCSWLANWRRRIAAWAGAHAIDRRHVLKIAMVGSGYVGLVSGACFADFGHDVVCIDKDATKIERLNAGQMPIYEPGLDELVARNVAAGRLSFTTDLASALDGAGAVFIAVGTPSRRGDGHADL